MFLNAVETLSGRRSDVTGVYQQQWKVEKDLTVNVFE